MTMGKEKDAVDLRENKEGCMGGIGEKKEKSYVIMISKQVYKTNLKIGFFTVTPTTILFVMKNFF